VSTASGMQTKRERQRSRRQERLDQQRSQAQRDRRRRRVRTAALGLVALLAVVALAVLLTRGTDRTLGVPEPQVADDAAALPPLPADGQDPAVGASAPDVTGYDPQGEPVAIGGTGRAQALLFVASWCPHCQEELPRVVEWQAEGNLPEGVDLVAVSTLHDPNRPNWPPDEWLTAEGWQGEVLVDSTDAVQAAYGLQGTPYWVFVDADGTVAGRHSGELDPAALTAAVEAIAPG
jgi:thiol-disulfide isomerase/thioredoxin